MFGRIRLLPLVAAFCFCCATALAQWTNQTITLRPGWNAVFLEVQPAPGDCDTLFAGLPVESVWGWNRRFSSVQYVQDPNTLIPGQPNWLCYVPPSSTNRAVNNLFVLRGDQAYLIKLANNASPVAWTIRGVASVRGVEWLSDSLNLVGFHIDPGSPPTFQSFFATSAGQAGQPIHRLSANGTWVRVTPSTDRLNPGEAYWIQCVGQSSYAGPVSITFEQGRGVDYGRILKEQTLTIHNNTTNARTLTLTQLPSGAPTGASYPALAGDVPLSYWRSLFPTNFGFVPFPVRLTNTIPPGGQWALRLAVRRADMRPFSLPAGFAEASYQSLLQVTDGAGTRWMVPVTAAGLQSHSQAALRLKAGVYAQASAATTPDPHAGLWVGSAIINQINQPANLTNGVIPFATATEFQLRLLLHVDDGGQVRMLHKVLQMWKDGTYSINANGFQVVDQPGRYVLVTDDNLIPQFSGSALRDGQRVARRFSSTAFAFPNPISLAGTGDFGASNSVYSCTNTLDYDDALNPFRHPYHPDHDNLDDRFAQRLPEGVESFSVTRQIQLQFTTTDPDGLTLAGWGDNQLGGIYRETIRGLHNSTLYVQGTFRLQQASRVGILNDGL
jgi:hypothetical protein